MSGGDFRFVGTNRKRQAQRAERQEQFLTILSEDPLRSKYDICADIGITHSAYRQWRQKDHEFAARVDLMVVKAGGGGGNTTPYANGVSQTQLDFVSFRKHYFGFDTTWFQLAAVNAVRNATPGSITLCLWPPEHGKTSLTEDDFCYSFSYNPSYRITNVSEGLDMARKMSRKLMKRMDARGPAPNWVRDFGPFKEIGRQAWSVDEWSIAKARLSDERDYTFACGGWSSAIAGTRTDRLHVDDMQSVRSLELTEKMMTVFRQDMLSRPGERGITTMNGTRVGEHDVYARIIDEFEGEDFFTLIQFPALVTNQVTGEVEPLWPYDEETGVGYTMEMLARLRKKVGEEAWWRNYMQKPKQSSLTVFIDESIERAKNHARSYAHPRVHDAPADAWICLDPSIGGQSGLVSMSPAGKHLVLTGIIDVKGARNNAELADHCRAETLRLKTLGYRPSTLIIEAMAFQKGLMEDPAFEQLARDHGLVLVDHLTGNNKYDENIGVPSMAGSLMADQIDLAYADDVDRFLTDLLCAEMRAWKPRKAGARVARGNQLRQDKLMALWFGWIRWVQLRGSTSTVSPDAFTVGGLPYSPTATGLLVPTA